MSDASTRSSLATASWSDRRTPREFSSTSVCAKLATAQNSRAAFAALLDYSVEPRVFQSHLVVCFGFCRLPLVVRSRVPLLSWQVTPSFTLWPAGSTRIQPRGVGAVPAAPTPLVSVSDRRMVGHRGPLLFWQAALLHTVTSWHRLESAKRRLRSLSRTRPTLSAQPAHSPCVPAGARLH